MSQSEIQAIFDNISSKDAQTIDFVTKAGKLTAKLPHLKIWNIVFG